MTHNERELNTGAVVTGQSCKGCNKCIAVCPSPGANIAVLENNEKRVYVDAEYCLNCGKCLTVCPHESRIFFDDMAKLLEGLAAFRAGTRKRPISVVVDPSFEINYPDKYAYTLGWLRSLGVQNIYSTGMGSDIMAWAYLQYFQKTGARSMISSYCPVVVDYVERYRPDAVSSLVPIMSPLLCTAVYLRNYMHMEHDLAFIGPCIARKGESMRPENRSYVQYVVTFSRLVEAAGEPDGDHFSTAANDATLGSISCMRGGVREIAERFIGSDPEQFIVLPSGDNHAKSLVDTWCADGRELFSDIRSCDTGCVYGPCTGNKDIASVRRREAQTRASLSQRLPGETPQSALDALCERLQGCHYDDFLTGFSVKQNSPPLPSKAEVDAAFRTLSKLSREEQCVDCTSCGYDNCRLMARAIAMGHNHPGNCADYTSRLLSVERARADMLTRRINRLEAKAPAKSSSGIDPLTGLGTRFIFEQFMEGILTRTKGNDPSGYVFSVDLDDFTTINESYGHSFGNALLVEFTRFLKETLGGLCELFRASGDQFILVAEGADAAAAKFIGDTLVGRGQNVWRIMSAGIYCTVSVGIVQFPDLASCVSNIVKNVEIAMNIAKQQGKNRCVLFTPDMTRDSGAKSKAALQMREAVAQNFEGFDVHYRPWVTRDGTLVGAEALLRWQSGDGSWLHPAELIDISELSGLIVPLDEFVLRTAALKAREIRDLHPGFLMTVNLSVRSFSRSDLLQCAMGIIDSAGINRAGLALEITEPGDAETLDKLKDTFAALHACGVKLVLDDLSSGYGSPGFLNDLPFDFVKMNRSFIRAAETDSHVKDLLSATVDFMHKIGRKVCVKGVESRGQLNLCENAGAEIVQGPLFFSPMPSAKLTQLTQLARLSLQS